MYSSIRDGPIEAFGNELDCTVFKITAKHKYHYALYPTSSATDASTEQQSLSITC